MKTEGEKKNTRKRQRERDGNPEMDDAESADIVAMSDVLVWPLHLEDGKTLPMTCGRIPLSAFHYLRLFSAVDLATHEFCFSSRGEEFFVEVHREGE